MDPRNFGQPIIWKDGLLINEELKINNRIYRNKDSEIGVGTGG
jgi:hypothetical protein